MLQDLQIFDPELTVNTAARLAPAGSRIRPKEAVAEATGLRGAAAATLEHVWRISELSPQPTDTEVLVVDRPGWATVLVDSFQHMIAPGLEQLAEQQPELLAKLTTGPARKAAAVQLGGALAYLSTRVLGQYDPFTDRLVLVAPNTYAVRERIEAEPTDFRAWVCLHEQTHRVQFAAAPWLREHMLELITRLLERSLQSKPDTESEAITELISEATGIMSLLEGHANLIMDAAPRQLIPTQPEIRERFNQRKTPGGPLGALLSRMLNMKEKLGQYKHGQKFCTAVVDRIGMTGLNRVFEAPEFLPTEAEIQDPQAWIDRVHGQQ